MKTKQKLYFQPPFWKKTRKKNQILSYGGRNDLKLQPP